MHQNTSKNKHEITNKKDQIFTAISKSNCMIYLDLFLNSHCIFAMKTFEWSDTLLDSYTLEERLTTMIFRKKYWKWHLNEVEFS